MIPQMNKTRLTLMLLLLSVSEILATENNNTKIYKESDDVLFRLDEPETPITIIYQQGPSLTTVKLYVHKNVTDFNITLYSTKIGVAAVSEVADTTKCSNSTSAPPVITGPRSKQSINAPVHVEVNAQSADKGCYTVSFYATPVYLGYSAMPIVAHYQSKNGGVISDDIGSKTIKVVRVKRASETVFKVVVYTVIIVSTFGMGCDISLDTIKGHLKKPKAPAVALASQYIFMPLLSFTVLTLTGYTGGWALGYFLMGIVPGGGVSNMCAKLFNADLSLSITLTNLSTIASMAMLPFWLYTLGQALPVDDEVGRIPIPFLNIFISLMALIIPLLLGAVVRYKLPRVREIILRCLKVYFLIIMFTLLGFSIYENFYIFYGPIAEAFAVSAILPYGGFLFGAIFSWICHLDSTVIKTTSLETGMQNYALALLIVKTSLRQPDADVASIPIIAAIFMTMCPLTIIAPTFFIREKILKKMKASKSATNNNKEEEGNAAKHKLADMTPTISGSEANSSGSVANSSTQSERETLCGESEVVQKEGVINIT